MYRCHCVIELAVLHMVRRPASSFIQSLRSKKQSRNAITGVPLRIQAAHHILQVTDLCRRLEGVRETLDVGLKVTLVAEELDVAAIDLDPALLALLRVLLAAEAGEAPVLANNDLLTAGEL
jgi:hypothetical protein